jgi:protease PrsW
MSESDFRIQSNLSRSRAAGASAPDSTPAMSPLVSQRIWWLVLTVGCAVWLFAAGATALTDDVILVPAVLLLGSFLMPVTMVMFALSRASEGNLTAEVLLLGFLAAGTVGVVASALTETYILPSAQGTFIVVGLVEETAKGLVLLAVAHQVAVRRPRDGMVLGATVGAGFAAFESAGYALRAFIDHGDDNAVLSVVQSEAFRAILSPFMHITWTALLGGALFAAAATSPRGAFRVTQQVVWTFVGVVALHAVWDQSYGWGIVITQGVVGGGWNLAWPNTEIWVGTPSGEELWVFDAAYYGLFALSAIIATVWVVRSWRGYGGSRAMETRGSGLSSPS